MSSDEADKRANENAFVAQLNNFEMGWNKCRAMWMENWDNQKRFHQSMLGEDDDNKKSLICLTIWVEAGFGFN